MPPTSTAHVQAAPTKSWKNRTVLIVDDEEDVVESLADVLAFHMPGLRTKKATSGAQAVPMLEQRPIDVVVADYKMSGMDGITLLRKAKEMLPDVPRVMITAYPTRDLAARASEDAAVHRVFIKPIDPIEIAAAVRELLDDALPEPMPMRALDAVFVKHIASDPSD